MPLPLQSFLIFFFFQHTSGFHGPAVALRSSDGDCRAVPILSSFHASFTTQKHWTPVDRALAFAVSHHKSPTLIDPFFAWPRWLVSLLLPLYLLRPLLPQVNSASSGLIALSPSSSFRPSPPYLSASFPSPLHNPTCPLFQPPRTSRLMASIPSSWH